MKKVAFKSFGCKVNFCETSTLAETFAEKNWQVVPFEEKADVYIIDSCAVTATAEQKCKKAVKQARKKNPNAMIIMTGCFPEVYPEKVGKIKELDLAVGVSTKLCGKIYADSSFSGRARVFVKVQQGCEVFCSYCIVPLARGREKSVPAREVVEKIKKLVEEKGFKEVVLTGTNLSRYKDPETEKGLSYLIEQILSNVENLYILRLSSLEPIGFTEDLFDVLSEEKIASHFHIPLQSASDKILKLMNRKYSSEDFSKIVEKLTEVKKDPCIGTDIIAGFPGEEEKDFEKTLNFLKELPFSYFHVFPFSPREKTKAFHFDNKVPEKVIRKRTDILRKLSEEKFYEYRKRQINRVLKGICLGNLVLTENYIFVKTEKPYEKGTALKVKIKKVGKGKKDNEGEVISVE